MKIAIVGAGAIGGLVGARLALAGEQVTFLVRGANLAAVRANGIRLVAADGTESVAGEIWMPESELAEDRSQMRG